MTETSNRRRGRPVRLPQRSIVAAATELLATAGEDGFSMRRLANDLGVSTAAIYHHFPTKAALLAAVLEALAESLPRPELPPAPRERLITLVTYLIDTLHRLPWVTEILVAGQSGARAALWILDEFIVAARELGASERQAGFMYFTVWRFVVGELTSRRAAAAHDEAGPQPALPYWSDLTEVDQLAQCPAVASLLPQWAEIRSEFRTETAVTDIIDGLLLGIARAGAGEN